MRFTYKYCLDKWEEQWATEFQSDFGYHETAENIARHEDNESAEYPDERVVVLMDVKHDTPRTMKVWAETELVYSAREQDS